MTDSAPGSTPALNSRIEGLRDMEPADRRQAIAGAAGLDQSGGRG